MISLGRIYEEDENILQSRYWLKKAGDTGNSDGYMHMAYTYNDYGNEKYKNEELYESYMRKSAFMGNWSAMDSLSTFYSIKNYSNSDLYKVEEILFKKLAINYVPLDLMAYGGRSKHSIMSDELQFKLKYDLTGSDDPVLKKVESQDLDLMGKIDSYLNSSSKK